jgi:hypothetical protein
MTKPNISLGDTLVEMAPMLLSEMTKSEVLAC